MTKSAIPDAALSQHIAVVGKTGSGKTYAAKGIVEGLLAAGRRVCVLDPTGAWYGLRSSANGKQPGFPIAVFGGLHGDVTIAEQSGAALAHILATKNLPAIIDLSELLIGQRHRFVTDFCEALYRENRTPLHLVIDEADEFCPQNPMPETKRMLHHVDRIVRRGRIRGFRVLMITQRPAVLHKNVLTQANTLVAMRLTAPQDRKAIQAWVEGQADVAQGKAVMDSLARLQRDVLERTTFPKITTFDSSRTPDNDEVVQQPTKLAAVDIDEIRASFVEIEQEAKSLVDLKTENAKIKRELASVQREVARARDAYALPLKHAPAPDLNLHKTQDESTAALRKIQAIVAKALENVSGGVLSVADRVASKKVEPRIAVGADVQGLRSGAVRILQELAARAPAGYTKPQVGALTRFSHKGGTFGTYLSNLRNAGFVEERDGLLFASDAGIEALGDKRASAPTSHHEAMNQWRGALRAGAFTMLQVIIDAGDRGIDRPALANATSMTASGGTFGTYLSNLRSNGLITERDRRCFANDILFPGP